MVLFKLRLIPQVIKIPTRAGSNRNIKVNFTQTSVFLTLSSPLYITNTMKAYVVKKWLKGPEELTIEETPVVEPKQGEVQVQVKAVGLNFFDTLMVSWHTFMNSLL